MRLIDVNVLVYAHRADVPEHPAYRAFLEGVVNAPAPFGLPSSTLSGFLRIVTNPRVFPVPTPLRDAVDFVRLLAAQPQAIRVAPGPRHLELFLDLCVRTKATAKLVADAELAALTIEVGGELWSADRDFARFPGLRWRHPLDPEQPQAR